MVVLVLGMVPVLGVIVDPRVVLAFGVIPDSMVVPLLRVVPVPGVTIPRAILNTRMVPDPRVVPVVGMILGVIPLPRHPVRPIQMEEDTGHGLSVGHRALQGHSTNGPGC